MVRHYPKTFTVKPVKYDTPRDQGNVSQCAGCWNTQILF